LGANDGKAITDTPDTASIATAARAFIILGLPMLVINLGFSTTARANRCRDAMFIWDQRGAVRNRNGRLPLVLQSFLLKAVHYG
jgi:hypothetical protein